MVNGDIYILKYKQTMAKEKSLVEEAIIQMKNLEEAVAENAKGILASTMKEEIKELVKESLSEQEDDDEIDTDVEMDEPEMDDQEGDDMDMDNMNPDDETMDDEETIDLSGEDDMDEVLRVFSLMGPEDNIVVKKDEAGNINLKDSEKEYMIVGENVGVDYMNDMEEGDDLYEMDDVEGDESIEDIVEKVFGRKDRKMMAHDDEEMEMNFGDEDMEMDFTDDDEMDLPSAPEEDRPGGMFYEDEDDEENEGIVYEIMIDDLGEGDDESSMGAPEFGEGSEFDIQEPMEGYMDEDYMDEDYMDEDYMDEEYMDEDYMDEDEDNVMESKMTVKPKGVGMGNPGKFKYSSKPNTEGGFKVVKKKVNKTMGTGKAKFEYKEGENLEGKMKPVKKTETKESKKMETKEAARTYGKGSKSGRGLRKAITPNRNLTFESTTKEVQILREKNEEYRKALNVFRNKLNEVAVFNSNLAYATRLFTEHSTSKQEKINILRRFDSVETLKESKNLYRVIKDELSVKTSQPMNESFERKIENVQNTGSSVNLIESKTYENPQFLRMKDLMAKIK